MSQLVKLNNQGVKNATAFGSITGLGSMIFIKKLTASSSATLSFVDGSDGVVLDDTYKEYVFTFNNMHPATDSANFQFNGIRWWIVIIMQLKQLHIYAYHNEDEVQLYLRYDTR